MERRRGALCRKRGALRAASGSAARRDLRGDLLVDVPAESRFTGKWCASAPRPIRSRSTRSSRLHYVEVAEARHGRSVERFPPSRQGTRRAMGADGARAPSLPCCAACRRRCAPAHGAVTACGAARARHRRALSGLQGAGLRPCLRYRLDDGRGASVRSRQRRRARLERPDEPADPARRGSDEPRLLRDDASGRRRASSRKRCTKRSRRSRPRRRERPASRRDDIVEVTLAGNPIMHHLVLGLDPTELGGAPFALTIDAGFDAPARELGLDDRARRLRLRAALHRGPCRGRCGRRRPVRSALSFR